VPRLITKTAAERKRLDEIKYSVKVSDVMTPAITLGSDTNWEREKDKEVLQNACKLIKWQIYRNITLQIIKLL
jgi:hypothetical protein